MLETNAFDQRTIERIAELIVGEEPWCPKARGSYQLSSFFEALGFLDFEHDGSSKRAWVKEKLKKASKEQLARTILRLASAKEYDGNERAHIKALNAINNILGVEGLQVRLGLHLDPKLESGEPRYTLPLDNGLPSTSLEEPGLEAISDADLSPVLRSRWKEACRCFESGAYLAATIMIGSVLETVLGVALRRNSKALETEGIELRDRKGNPLPLDRWSLGDMLDVSYKLGWTRDITKKFSDVVRDYRNLVHPFVQLRSGYQPGSEECRISAIVLSSIIRDLRTNGVL